MAVHAAGHEYVILSASYCATVIIRNGGIMLIEVEVLAMVVLGAIFYALAGRKN